MLSAALAIAGVTAAVVSVVLHRATVGDGSHRPGALRDNGWSIVLMVDGVLLLATSMALVLL